MVGKRVDHRRGIDNQIHGFGQPPPHRLVQAQVGFALVACDDLQPVGGKLLEVPQQFRVTAIEGLLQTTPRILVGLRPHQTDQPAVDVQPPQQFKDQIPSEETRRARQQDRP